MFDCRTASTKGPGPIHPTAKLAAAVSLGNLYCDSFRLVIEEPSCPGQTTNTWVLVCPLSVSSPGSETWSADEKSRRAKMSENRLGK